MYTFFMFPKSISTTYRSDYSYQALQCIEYATGSTDIVEKVLRQFSYLSIKDITSNGKFLCFKGIKLGLLICVDEEDKVDINSFKEALEVALDETICDGDKVQIIRPDLKDEVEIIPQLIDIAQDAINMSGVDCEITPVSIKNLRKHLSIDNTVH